VADRARLFRDVNGAAADDRTTARASAEFRQSHPNRHSGLLVFQCHVANDAKQNAFGPGNDA
jgi:hypothetical protein